MVRSFCLMLAWAVMACADMQEEGVQGGAEPLATAPVQASEGKQIFRANCAQCHSLKRDLVGPALLQVHKRWPDEKKLVAYIKNAPAMIKKDKYARDLWLKWNKAEMPAFPQLKDEEIMAILAYIREEGGK